MNQFNKHVERNVNNSLSREANNVSTYSEQHEKYNITQGLKPITT